MRNDFVFQGIRMYFCKYSTCFYMKNAREMIWLHIFKTRHIFESTARLLTLCFFLFQVEVIYMWESLPDEYTLMDVAYIYTWKRVSFVPHKIHFLEGEILWLEKTEPQCSKLFLLLELIRFPADTNNATLKDACTERNVKQSYGSLPENRNAIKTRQKKKKSISFWQHLSLRQVMTC